jgi:serine/threonine-protein kinase
VKESGALLAGETFEGRFEILSVLGQGGAGVVYKARQVHMDKVVAIKTLRPTVLNDESGFRRFEQEARAASNLSHPNIVQVFDFGLSSLGFAYLVMEYLPGRSLDEKLQQEERVELDVFLRVFSQTCDGLQHAHRKGVIHRDIKPSNIVLVATEEATDVAKIVDFGLAKFTAAEIEQHLTQTGAVVGTPLFMSPEQCSGAELDPRTDIYSLGCVMYAALTGHVPLKGDSAMNTIYKRLTQEPEPFSVVAPELNLPAALEHVVMKTLQKHPDDRQQSMSELRNELTNAIFFGHRSEAAIAVSSERDQPNHGDCKGDEETQVALTKPPPTVRQTPAPTAEPHTSSPSRRASPPYSNPALPVVAAAVVIAAAGGFFWTQKHGAKEVNVPPPKSAPAAMPPSGSPTSGTKRSAPKKEQPVKHAVSPPAAKPHPRQLASAPVPKPISTSQPTVQELEKRGIDFMQNQQFAEADACFKQCLKAQIARRADDKHLVITYGRLLHCIVQAHDQSLLAYVNDALVIVNRSQRQLCQDINGDTAVFVWRSLGHAMMRASESDPSRRDYYSQWAANMFDIAFDKCEDREKKHAIADEFCRAANQGGTPEQRARAAQLSGRPAPPEPRPRKPAPHRRNHGRGIWQR